ncbi:hypothetical protein SKAU_G00229210 [Synaphobranchus kaupii]|uniref:Uncharacterized protein n=1 Tax=Synaphobranchus kaupii TaxID=118154 RepID=A0A9Q1IS71_SYNKA|nr:hypothetical protein SKAU_G00229210 [Synaphobranchus kaupii]
MGERRGALPSRTMSRYRFRHSTDSSRMPCRVCMKSSTCCLRSSELNPALLSWDIR